ncbi:hypothetical protein OGATHE_000453 [Ogataea polymorpha]|uniref:G domain-containing protein n=1 Tax=Ogataea polymorpha TaxID=460523 RepID=A0A9P8PUV1_9ASCO|nr:hypothetical protein OGATHE_000453 [Ogataea polymorpha]
MAVDQQRGPDDGLPDSALNPADYSSVVKTIPDNSPDTKVLYTLSARYFPLNLKVSIFDTLKSKSIPARNVLFVITFADQVLEKPLERDADLQTLRESYWRSLNSYLSLYSSQTIDRENVMVTSTKYPRSITKLFEKLIHSDHKTYYVIGQTNTGKSSLVQRLIVESNDYQSVPVVPKVSAKPCSTRRNGTFVCPYFGLTLVDTPGMLPKTHSIYAVLRPQLRQSVLSWGATNSIRTRVFTFRDTEQVLGLGPCMALRSRGHTGPLSLRQYFWGPTKLFRDLAEWQAWLADRRYVCGSRWTAYKLHASAGLCDVIISNLGFVRFENGCPPLTVYMPSCLRAVQRFYADEDHYKELELQANATFGRSESACASCTN